MLASTLASTTEIGLVNSPRVPNYRQGAYAALPALREATTFGLRGGLRAVGYVRWDEDQAKLVR
jgi:hypothetical protein